MDRSCVAAVDGARARIYRVDVETLADGRASPCLVEIEDLINPAGRARDSELFSDSRPGLRKAHAGGPGHGVDDHRDAHTAEMERRFAADVVDAVAERARAARARRVVLVAAPQMLGHLRPHLDKLRGHGLDVREFPKHLTWREAHELHDELAAQRLLPQRVRASTPG